MANHLLLDNSIRIFIIGYFGHSNTGDQQYLLTFDYIFKHFLITHENYITHYLDCDHVKITQFKDTDIIILGGGDILNNYFLDQIISKFLDKPNKIIAVSVGLPYTDIIINTNKLNIIDYIFVRTQQDLELFKTYFHPHRIFFLPDLSFFLLNIHTHINLHTNNHLSTKSHLQNIHNNGQKIIAITLSRHIYDPKSPHYYHNIIQSFIKFIKYLLTFQYYVVLLPFNTNTQQHSENDIIIHNHILDILKDNPHISNNILNLTTHLEPLEILDLYQYFYLTIPMRFHATLFSIYTNVPMLPIFTTRKIKNLLLDVNWLHGYQLDCNEKDIPTHIDEVILINRFRNVISLRQHLSNKLLVINRDFFTNNLHHIKHLMNLITCDYSKISFSLNTNYIHSTINDVFIKLQETAQKYGINDFRNTQDIHIQKLLTQMVSYYLTNGSIESPYSYGLSTKMFQINYNYQKEWEWIIKDNNKKYLQRSNKIFNNPYGLFNINYIDQIDYSNAHRSGWQFVYENIKYLHNDSSNLYLDLYLDKTFHWNKTINKELNIIPYRHNWIGFIHHTFDTSFSDYNNHNLFHNQDFLDSLLSCKGIFVLSKYLKDQLEIELKYRHLSIPIFHLTHPTEINVPLFTPKKLLYNSDKKLIHIGGWLRDIYSFYNLYIPPKYKFQSQYNICDFSSHYIEEPIRKVILKGTHMNNYYPSPQLPNLLQHFLKTLDSSTSQSISQNTSQNTSQNCSQNISQNCSQNASQNCSQNSQELRNNWYRHFYTQVKYICDNVDFIDKLSNEQYDELLTENIVFINLVDASAVNTIIECIVRHTPIIINDHPAVVELLGKNYPLYFNHNYQNYFELNQQVFELLSNTNNIKKAHYYLTQLHKSKFNIKNFIHDFVNCIKTIST